MENIDVKTLTKKLLHYCHEYYDLDSPSISDTEYDRLLEELRCAEEETGFSLPNSPTKKVQGEVLGSFNKITHSKPMLSAAKTKSLDDIKRFINGRAFYCSYKLDGLTLLTIFEGGHFKQAITRGTGLIGEDVTAQARMISNLPMTIDYTGRLELRGECVVSWEQFRQANSTMEEPFSHPRNYAAGSLRQLNTNTTKERKLSYVVFECVSGLGVNIDDKWNKLKMVQDLGFEIVQTSLGTVNDCLETMKPEYYGYPVDGLIYELRSEKESKTTSSTGHHEGCRMALKWIDDMYETILRDVVWQTSRSGIINPVAVFDEVDLAGALTTRATLHNVSIIEGLELGIGDTITVYRSNMVIPKIDNNLTRSNTLTIPDACPCCNHKAIIRNNNNSKFLYCTNPNCPAKLISLLEHFCSRKCMNIEGMSTSTIEFLINKGWVKNFIDIYHLSNHKSEWERCDGFGKTSVNNILAAIEKSRNVDLTHFITALSIPTIGSTASKIISDYCDDSFNKFVDATLNTDWTSLPTFGETMAKNIDNWIGNYGDNMGELAQEFNFIKEEKAVTTDNPFVNKIICVTGKLEHFNRDSINAKIESLGAKVVSSVNTKTDYLLTNTPNSRSAKNLAAKKFGTKIITEVEFLKNIEGNK